MQHGFENHTHATCWKHVPVPHFNEAWFSSSIFFLEGTSWCMSPTMITFHSYSILNSSLGTGNYASNYVCIFLWQPYWELTFILQCCLPCLLPCPVATIKQEEFSGMFANLLQPIISFMSAHVEKLSSHGQIFITFDIWVFFDNLWRQFTFHSNWTRITGTLHEDQYTFFISCSLLPIMRNGSDRVVDKIQIHILRSVTFYLKIVPFMR
jgi:hypothetical protein